MTNFRIPGQRALVALVSAGLLAGCLDASDNAPDTQIINTAPVANAGPDQADVPTSTLVTLDGSGSSDADGDELLYTWEFVTLPAGSTATLANATTPLPTLTPPQPTFTPDIAGTYTIRLTVDDTFGTGTSSDTVNVLAIVPPTNPPVANAGPDQDLSFAPPALTVNLDGSGSTDPDNDPLTFAWVITSFVPSGVPPATNVSLVGAATATPSFDVTDIDQLGEYTVRLTVSDGTLQSTDDVVITVDKSAPTASVLFGSGALASAALAWTSRKRRRNRAATGAE